MGCFIGIVPIAIIFLLGFGIGYAAFKNSPRRVAFSVLSGFTALVVSVAVVFAGCLLLISSDLR